MTEKPQLVNEIIKRVKEQTLDSPQEITDYVDKLSASIWDIGTKKIKADMDFAIKWKDIRKHTSSDKQADIEIMTTDEFKEREQCKYAEKTVIETIRSLKKRLSILAEEFHAM